MFDDLVLWTKTVDWVEVLVNFFLLVAPTLLVLAGSFLAGTAFWRALQAFVATIRSGFDETTDPAILYLSKLLKLPADTLVAIAVALIDAILANPEARQLLAAKGYYPVPTQPGLTKPPQPTPPQERNLTEDVK